MKKILPILLFQLCLAFSLQAGITIQGLWQAAEANVQIEIQEDYAGIKVRRTDENRWYYYEFDGNGTYRNSEGAKYQLYSDDELVYVNDFKGQRLRFYKNRGRLNTPIDVPWYLYEGRRVSYISAAKLLDGLWAVTRTRDRILIDRRGRDLLVTINGRSRTYRPTNNGYFADRFGNRVKLTSNNRAWLDHQLYRRPLSLERLNGRRPGRNW